MDKTLFFEKISIVVFLENDDIPEEDEVFMLVIVLNSLTFNTTLNNFLGKSYV